MSGYVFGEYANFLAQPFRATKSWSLFFYILLWQEIDKKSTSIADHFVVICLQ